MCVAYGCAVGNLVVNTLWYLVPDVIQTSMSCLWYSCCYVTAAAVYTAQQQSRSMVCSFRVGAS